MLSNPNSNASSSTKLAPGFRFHPTDEELVSYYLKRRVLGRRIAVDAIADVDLYKHEPWDLPALSRLQSRDVEWYFFSPLDRKYSNRSRTNRATSRGYWKTTGKDRSVQHGGRTVGMKKTLVFHFGRAPRGERTNWVMHEYRLEDEGLTLSGVSQDGFVVCRIFQKSGAGPQNGAQYGAPFVEEEWEEGDDLVIQTVDEDKLFSDAGDQEYFQMNDILQDPEVGIQHGNIPLLVAGIDGETNEGHQPYISGCDGHANVPEVQDNHVADNDLGEGILKLDQSWSSSHNDGYVELNDFVETMGADQPMNEKLTAFPVGPYSNQSSPIDMVEFGDFPEINVDEFFDILNENSDVQEAFPKSSTMPYNGILQTNACTKTTSGNHAFAQLAENNSVQYGEPDAPSNDLPSFGGDFVHNSNFCPPMAEACAFDKVDELMEYFDATDNNLHYVTLSPSGKVESGEPSNGTQTCATPEFVGSSIPTCDASPHTVGTDAENAASSSAASQAINDGLGSKQEAFTDQDVQGNENCQKTVRKHLLTMLASISSPPAFAAEFPADAVEIPPKHPASLPTSSIHVTAGMIHISSLTVTGTANNWSLQKSGDPRFLLSFGVAGKLESFQPTAKVYGGFMSMVLRGGLYIFFLSTLVLAAGFKIGVHIYSRSKGEVHCWA